MAISFLQFTCLMLFFTLHANSAYVRGPLQPPRQSRAPAANTINDESMPMSADALASVAHRFVQELQSSLAAPFGNRTEAPFSELRANIVQDLLTKMAAQRNSTLASAAEGVATTAGGPAAAGRRLAQLLPDEGPQYANAFRLIFGNFLDLFDGSQRFWASVLRNLGDFLINANWIAELAELLEGPLEERVNAAWLPLPQDDSDVINLLLGYFSDYCVVELVIPPQIVLGSVTGPTFSITYQPPVCPIERDPDTGEKVIQYEDCEAGALVLTTTAAVVQGPFISPASYESAFCRYEWWAGSDVTASLGGGLAINILRRSVQGLNIIPVVNQFQVRAFFEPFFGDEEEVVEYEEVVEEEVVVEEGEEAEYVYGYDTAADPAAYVNDGGSAANYDAVLNDGTFWEELQPNDDGDAGGKDSSASADKTAAGVPLEYFFGFYDDDQQQYEVADDASRQPAGQHKPGKAELNKPPPKAPAGADAKPATTGAPAGSSKAEAPTDPLVAITTDPAQARQSGPPAGAGAGDGRDGAGGPETAAVLIDQLWNDLQIWRSAPTDSAASTHASPTDLSVVDQLWLQASTTAPQLLPQQQQQQQPGPSDSSSSIRYLRDMLRPLSSDAASAEAQSDRRPALTPTAAGSSSAAGGSQPFPISSDPLVRYNPDASRFEKEAQQQPEAAALERYTPDDEKQQQQLLQQAAQPNYNNAHQPAVAGLTAELNDWPASDDDEDMDAGWQRLQDLLAAGL